jgi:hypothetical protein
MEYVTGAEGTVPLLGRFGKYAAQRGTQNQNHNANGCLNQAWVLKKEPRK